MRRRFPAVVLAAVCALAPACGNGDGNGNQAAPTTQAVVDPAAADREAGERANLKATDFPSGWSARPHEPLPGEEQLNPDIARCLGISPPSERATVEVRSEDFTQMLATVSSVITFVRSESEAAADAEALTSDRFPECMKPGYEKQIHDVAPEGNTVSNVNATRIDFPAYGDRSAAYRLTATAHIPGPNIDVPINIDVVNIFKGRAEVEIVVVAPGSAFPTEFVANLANAVTSRL